MTDWCTACNTLHMPGRGHYPLYDVRMADEDDWIPVRALDAKHAAERFMEYCWANRDGWEWIIPRSGEGVHVVTVRDDKRGVTTIRVVAELRPHYSCMEMDA